MTVRDGVASHVVPALFAEGLQEIDEELGRLVSLPGQRPAANHHRVAGRGRDGRLAFEEITVDLRRT